MTMKRENPMLAYGAVTAAYWAFMLTDGALRMLVLLHFHTLGFSPVSLAYLFLLYELMGVVTNLSAGWIAARFGLSSTLYAGLSLQVIALLALSQFDPNIGVFWSVVFVMLVQGLSGVAKDLAKMSSKSAVKILAPSEDSKLFKWVAALTGSKNAVKGFGFLLGAVLLGQWGFLPAVLGMAAILSVILVAVVLFMPAGLPKGKKSAKFTDVFSKDARVNALSLARVFLFGARDVWFVVGIPIYFYSILSDGSEAGNRAAFFQIGSFMAVWIIAYGVVQAFAPKFFKTHPANAVMGQKWAVILAVIPLMLALCVVVFPVSNMLTILVVIGLLLFGFVFAVNSSLHSYLILSYSTSERVTMDVGFYYMSNAAGRLFGTVLSGVSYQIGGLAFCLAVAAAMVGVSALAMGRLSRVDALG
ncbi:MAG: organoarsenical effux MFS transporter ArsJ [Halocynthiibacter sp.]